MGKRTQNNRKQVNMKHTVAADLEEVGKVSRLQDYYCSCLCQIF